MLLLPALDRLVLQEAQGAHERDNDDAAGHDNDVLERDRASLFRPRRLARFPIEARLAVAYVILADPAEVTIVLADLVLRDLDLTVVLVDPEGLGIGDVDKDSDKSEHIKSSTKDSKLELSNEAGENIGWNYGL